MEPSKNSKNANKNFNKEASPERNSIKIKKLNKKLTDKLGPQWTKDELERFYKAYRKHGRDWKTVAVAVHNNRSVDMVEALFSMHQAYLSLPEGTASVAGFIAMITDLTDHYSLIEESESEGEDHGASGVSRKHQNLKHAKVPSSDIQEEVISPHYVASTEGCLSQLRLTQAYGIERRATGKRTFRIEYQRDNREGHTPPNKRANIQVEADDASTRSQAEESQSKHRASSIFVDTEASRDELEALNALAELSASLTPADLMALDSSAQWKEQRVANTVSTSYNREKSEQAGQEDSLLHESAEDDNVQTLIKSRHAREGPAKQQNTAKISEESPSSRPDAVVSASQVSGSGPVSLQQKPPHRCKMSLKKSLQEIAKYSETIHDKPHSSEHGLLKKKVSTCLSYSYPLARRRFLSEWFYNAIDYPWFTKMEFNDYLNLLGLGHVPRLKWSVIKSSLGRPRRFSERFIEEERDKLKQYHTELRAGAREGFPPLSVGDRVIAIHPKRREIRDGKILSVDHDKCNVLFDELGVEVVMDIDCMPLHLLEYMRRQTDNCLSVSKEVVLNRHTSSDASVLLTHVLENNDRNRGVTTDQSYNNTANNKLRRAEIQRPLILRPTSDAHEMEPTVMGIVSCSKSIANAMAASSVKDEKDSGKKMVDSREGHQLLASSIVSGMKHQDQTNGSLNLLQHHQSLSPSNTGELIRSFCFNLAHDSDVHREA